MGARAILVCLAIVALQTGCSGAATTPEQLPASSQQPCAATKSAPWATSNTEIAGIPRISVPQLPGWRIASEVEQWRMSKLTGSVTLTLYGPERPSRQQPMLNVTLSDVTGTKLSEILDQWERQANSAEAKSAGITVLDYHRTTVCGYPAIAFTSEQAGSASLPPTGHSRGVLLSVESGQRAFRVMINCGTENIDSSVEQQIDEMFGEIQIEATPDSQ